MRISRLTLERWAMHLEAGLKGWLGPQMSMVYESRDRKVIVILEEIKEMLRTEASPEVEGPISAPKDSPPKH